MPKRTKEQLLVEIKNLVGEISWSVTRSQRDGLEISWIGTAKRRAQELAVECQRLEDLESEGIEEAVQHLKTELSKDGN
ncbi:MAG: hypothetical protein ACOVNQ_10355 [Pirellula sp.]|jgi:hypothetical protein